jgi:putative tryptophan/tyrosine transport system substrate-binding protein
LKVRLLRYFVLRLLFKPLFAFLIGAFLMPLSGCEQKAKLNSINNPFGFVLIRIDDKSPDGVTRGERFRKALARQHLEQLPMTEVYTDAGVVETIAKDISHLPDSGQTIVLAGSSGMLDAARSHFRKAKILYASYIDPREEGVISPASDLNNATGFIYDRFSVPYIVNLFKRAGHLPKSVALIGDDSLSTVWKRRVQMLQKDLAPVQIEFVNVSSQNGFKKFSDSSEFKIHDALIFLDSDFLDVNTEWVISQVQQAKKKSIFPYVSYAKAGAPIAYWAQIDDPFGIWARQINLITNGMAPAQIPVEEPVKFGLALNLDAAKKVGFDISPSLIKAADQVFER